VMSGILDAVEVFAEGCIGHDVTYIQHHK
jgi:hypothetical protein